jgi:hypothetical protein
MLLVIEKMSLKAKLYEACRQVIQKRMAILNEERKALQTSANEETKSSVGDKYETGRAMIQLEIEKITQQSIEARRMQEALDRIDLKAQPKTICPGSVVQTDAGSYFISVNAGKVEVDSVNYLAISPGAPIASKMLGLTSGDTFTLNNRTFTIQKFI